MSAYGNGGCGHKGTIAVTPAPTFGALVAMDDPTRQHNGKNL